MGVTQIEKELWAGSCHCEAVQFSVRLPRAMNPHRCNCSICNMKSTIAIDFPADDLTVLTGDDVLSSYAFGTEVAKHWFCSVCGIHTFQNLRSDPDKCSVNAACLDGFDIWRLPSIPIHDGRDNHPSETSKPRRYIAVQKLELPDD